MCRVPSTDSLRTSNLKIFFNIEVFYIFVFFCKMCWIRNFNRMQMISKWNSILLNLVHHGRSILISFLVPSILWFHFYWPQMHLKWFECSTILNGQIGSIYIQSDWMQNSNPKTKTTKPHQPTNKQCNAVEIRSHSKNQWISYKRHFENKNKINPWCCSHCCCHCFKYIRNAIDCYKWMPFNINIEGKRMI